MTQYSDLAYRIPTGQTGQQVYNPTTGKAYSSPEQLATDLGILPHQIDWGKISSSAVNVNPVVPPPATTEALTTPKQQNVGLLPGAYKESDINKSLGLSTAPTVSPVGADIDTQLENISADLDNKFNEYNQAVNSTVLSASQQSIIEGIASEFAATRNEIRQANARLVSGTTIAGIVSGRNRYAPELNLGEIQRALDVGIKNVNELNSKMASTIAQLEEGMMEKNFSRINEGWNSYISYQKQKTDMLEKQKADIATFKKELQAQNEKDRDYELDNSNWEKQQSLISDVVKEAGKNNAPAEIINNIYNAKNLAEAVNAAGDYMQGGTGIVGEYIYYKRQAEALGQTPVDFSTYQNIDANRKKSIAAASGAGALGGISNTTLTKVQTIANQFDGEQIVKDYNQIIQSLDAVRNAGTSPTDDIQRVYAFAKIMDPNSVVREGEYKTVQDYSQALISKLGLKAKRVFDNAGFLTPEARSFMLTTLENRLASTEKAYNNLSDEYGRRINKITGLVDGKEYITDYSKPFGTANEILNSDDPLQIGGGQTNSNNPMGL
jgi:hypothetical protein